eukprot:3549259-Rhodomonas_salina.3
MLRNQAQENTISAHTTISESTRTSRFTSHARTPGSTPRLSTTATSVLATATSVRVDATSVQRTTTGGHYISTGSGYTAFRSLSTVCGGAGRQDRTGRTRLAHVGRLEHVAGVAVLDELACSPPTQPQRVKDKIYNELALPASQPQLCTSAAAAAREPEDGAERTCGEATWNTAQTQTRGSKKPQSTGA